MTVAPHTLPTHNPQPVSADDAAAARECLATQWNISKPDTDGIIGAVAHLLAQGEDITRIRKRLNPPANRMLNPDAAEYQMPRTGTATTMDIRRLQEAVARLTEAHRRHVEYVSKQLGRR